MEISDNAFHELNQQSKPHRSNEEITQAYAKQCHSFIRAQEQHLNHINVSTLVHRLGRFVARSGTQEYLCKVHATFLGRLMALVFLHAKTFDKRNIANVVWGMGKIGPLLQAVPIPYITFEILMDAIMDRAKGKTNREMFSHRHLSNFLYGLACLEHHRHKAQIEEFSVQAIHVMDDFLDSELSNFVWALGKFRHFDRKGVLAKAVQSAKKRVNSMGPQEISNFLWGLAVMEHLDCRDLLDMLLVPHTQNLWTKDKSSQTISMFVWSAHHLGFKIGSISADDLISSPFSQAARVDTQQTVDLSNFQPQHVVTVLYAYSQFGYKSKRVDGFVLATKIFFLKFASLFNNQDVSMMAWSLMMMDELDGATMSRILYHVRYVKPTDPLSPEDVRQLYQCLLHLRLLHPEVVISQVIPSEVEKIWRGVWMVRQRTSPVPDWVSHALVHLEKMGYVCKARCMVGGIVNTTTLDFEDGMKYALEGLSYTRQYTNVVDAPRANITWKMRLLRTLGYEIVELEESKWEGLYGEDKIREYLRHRVNTAKGKRRVEMLQTT